MNYDPLGGPATKLRIHDHPEDAHYYLLSDIHVGGVAFDDKAFQNVLDEVVGGDNRYVIGLGDYVTGSCPGHRYYDHLDVPVHEIHDLHTIGGQFDAMADLFETVAAAGQLVGLIEGNHDWRFRNQHAYVAKMAQRLNVPYLSVSSLITIFNEANDLDFFLAHVGKMLPKGAKDIRQRRANQAAALQRNLEAHFDSADLLAHGHTHQLKVTRPIESYKARVRDDEQNMHSIDIRWDDLTTKALEEHGYKYVHPYAKWYAVTGTFERTGITTDVTDLEPELYAKVPSTYAQQANFKPSDLGYVRVDVEEGRITNVEAVEV